MDPTEINQQLYARLDTLTNLVMAAGWPNDEDTKEEAITDIEELPLSIKVFRWVRVALSTTDWFDVFVDNDGEPTRIVYHYAGSQTTLEGPEFAAAEYGLRFYVEPELSEPVEYS